MLAFEKQGDNRKSEHQPITLEKQKVELGYYMSIK